MEFFGGDVSFSSEFFSRITHHVVGGKKKLEKFCVLYVCVTMPCVFIRLMNFHKAATES